MASARPTASTPWDDPSWQEHDSAWQRGLRLQQAWWRSERLGAPPGPHSLDKPDRLVNSNLPDGPEFHDANFLTPAIAQVVAARLQEVGAGGLIKPDRLRRSLLSSQPLCFNLFGQFVADPAPLLRWVRSLGCDATRISRIAIESAPPKEEHFGGGSAFDAFVEYELRNGELGFLGIECKYHEDLKTSDVKSVRPEYTQFTESSDAWRDGASTRLDRPGLRQFWLNTLLCQSLAGTDHYVEGRSVVAACAADFAAKAAVDAVRAELTHPDDLSWHPYEEIVGAITAIDAAGWKSAFIERYLDFSPIAHLLEESDPRRITSNRTEHTRLAMAFAVAERVLADGSTLDRLAAADDVDPIASQAVWHRLEAIVEDLKQVREMASRALGDPEIEW